MNRSLLLKGIVDGPIWVGPVDPCPYCGSVGYEDRWGVVYGCGSSKHPVTGDVERSIFCLTTKEKRVEQ